MKKAIIIVLVLIMAVVIGLQLFLAYGLTDSLRQWVLPMAKDRWNLDVTLERVSVNLLGGSLSIHGVQVINPPGFDDPSMITMKRFKLTIGLLALQGAVGGIQWALKLPTEIVWVHVALATLTWLAMLWTVATAGRLEPRA